MLCTGALPDVIPVPAPVIVERVLGLAAIGVRWDLRHDTQCVDDAPAVAGDIDLTGFCCRRIDELLATSP